MLQGAKDLAVGGSGVVAASLPATSRVDAFSPSRLDSLLQPVLTRLKTSYSRFISCSYSSLTL